MEFDWRKKDITAWYPYNIDKSVWEVQSNQSEDADYQASDFLLGRINGLTFAQREKELVFYHQIAKVIIRIRKKGPIISEKDIESVTIGDENFALKGSYTAPTGEDYKYGTWGIVANDTKGRITPHPRTLMTDERNDFVASYEALVIPYLVDKATTLFTITLQNNLTYSYKLPGNYEGRIEWNSGKQYIYNIELQGGRLDVTVAEGDISWGSGSGVSGNGSVEL